MNWLESLAKRYRIDRLADRFLVAFLLLRKPIQNLLPLLRSSSTKSSNSVQ
jgi:hypothetical protein